MVDVTLKTVGIKIDPKPAQDGAKQVEQSLHNVRTSADKVKGALLAAFTTISIGAAAREFAAYDQQLRNVATVAGATQQEFEKLNNTALDLALSTRFNPEEIAKGMYSLASAGQSVNQQLSTLPNVLNLAEAAQADLSTTTELVVSSMAQFGIEASDSQRIVDVFTASIASSATNVPRLQVAMANSGSTANAMNQEFESSVAVLSILTTAFGNGEKAGTGYKTLLNQLATNGEKLGLNVKDAAGDMLPLVDILEQIKESGTPATELMKTFGTEAGPALAVLLEQGTEAIEKMADSFESNGQAAETAAKQLDTLQGDWDQLMSTISVATIETIDSIEPALRFLVSTLTDAIQGLMDFAGGVKAVVRGAFGESVSDLESFGKSAKMLRDETDLLVESLKNVSAEQIKIELSKARTEFNELTSQLAKMRADFEDGGIWGIPDAAAESGLARRQEAIDQLRERIDELKESYKGVFAEEVKLKDENIKLTDGYTSLTKETEKYISQLFKKNGLVNAEIELLKGNKSAVDNYNKSQAVLIGQTIDEKNAISQAYDEYIKLNNEKERLIELQKEVNEAQEVFNRLMVESYRVLDPFVDIENKRIDQRQALQVLYNKELITFDQYIDGQKEITRQFNNEAAAVSGLGDELKNTGSIFESFFKSFEDNLKKSLKEIQKAFKDNPLEATAQFGSILPGILDSIQNNDSSARAANEIASQIPVPGIQAIASIINTLDQLFGGGLLGTNFETTGSGFNVALGSNGVDGSQYENQSRQRSLFRGTSRRSVQSELDSGFRDDLDNVLNAARQISQSAAVALGVEYVGLIEASLEQEFDKKGNLIKSVIQAFGREIEGGVDDLQRYLIGGSIFAQIASSAPGSSGEVNQIQDMYIGNSDRFLEAAQATLKAQIDINDGFNLLATGSLSEIIELTEDYSRAGEALQDTYSRLTNSFRIYDEALVIMGVSIDMNRRQAIEYSVAMADAAGGTNQLLLMWQGYYEGFYSEQELFIKQLESVNNEINGLNEQLGTDLNFDNFRESFEAAIPTLTPEEATNWLRLGNYLTEANMLAGQLAESSLAGAIEQYLGMADQLSEANYTLSERLDMNYQSITELMRAYDGSIEAEQQIADSLRSRYEMELAFIDQIRSASESVTAMIFGARESVALGGMSEEEQYNYFRGQSEEAALQATLATDPDEVQRLTSRALDYENRAFGLLDEGQQDQLREGFLEYIDQLGENALGRLAELEETAVDRTEELISSLGLMLTTNQEITVESNNQFAESVNIFQQNVMTMAQAIQALQNIQVSVNVNQQGYEIGGSV